MAVDSETSGMREPVAAQAWAMGARLAPWRPGSGLPLGLGLVTDRYVPAGGVGLRGVGQDARVACGDALGGPSRGRGVQRVDRDPPEGLVARHHDAFAGGQGAPLLAAG